MPGRHTGITHSQKLWDSSPSLPGNDDIWHINPSHSCDGRHRLALLKNKNLVLFPCLNIVGCTEFWFEREFDAGRGPRRQKTCRTLSATSANMPTSLHPQAKFDPVPPDLDLRAVVERTPNFKWVQRVSRAQIQNLGQLEFEKLIQIHVIAGGKPLVIDGWDSVLPEWLFNASWLEKTYDKKRKHFNAK